jgi:hypothetical protein
MLCAFLAGLLTIGAVVLMPGGESKTAARFPPQRESPSQRPDSAGDAEAGPHDQVTLTVQPPIPRLAIVVYRRFPASPSWCTIADTTPRGMPSG